MKKISPLRKILIEIVKDNINTIPSGATVLEIGCGYEDLNKSFVEAGGSEWSGIDVNKNSIASSLGSVNSIPFPDNHFDYVIASQTIEHWYEYCTTFDDGLNEINRVLKKEGALFMDYPVNLHGHPFFMLNKIIQRHTLFNADIWDVGEFKEFHPSKPYYTWKGTRQKIADQRFMQMLLKKRNTSSFIESVILRKKENVSARCIADIINNIKSKVLYSLLRFYKLLIQSINSLWNILKN